MTTFSAPMILTDAPPTWRGRIPWFTGWLLFAVFALAGWAWSPSKRWYASSEDDVAALVDRISEGESTRQVAYAVLLCYGLAMTLRPATRDVALKARVIYPVLLFVGWALVSVTWSTDRAMTAKRLVVFVAMVTTVVGLLKHYDIKQIAQIAMIISGFTMAFGLVNELRIIATDHPSFGQWRFGGMMHPNHAALNACILLAASQYLFRSTGRKILFAVAVVALLVLFATKSRTALMSGITLTAAFWVLSSKPSKLVWSLLLVCWLGAGAMWLSSLELMPDIAGFISMGREDVKTQDVSQLTGRTDIWKYAIMQADKDPNRTFIGYGFETFWTPENTRGVSDFVKFKICEGHCCYLDWYLELGLVGVGIYGLILLTAVLRWSVAARVLQSPSAAIAAAILFGTIVHGFAESSLGDAGPATLFVYASIAGAGLRRPDEEFA